MRGMKYTRLRFNEKGGPTLDWFKAIYKFLFRQHIKFSLTFCFVISAIYINFANYTPFKLCFEGKIEESTEVHVWGTPSEEWRRGMEVMTNARVISHYWKGTPGVQYWPNPRHQFGLDLTEQQRQLFARVSIIRYYGGTSIDVETVLTKPINLTMREIFWYTSTENGEGILQTSVFTSFRKSPFLLYWLRTFREEFGMEMRLSKLKIKPEVLINGGILSVVCASNLTEKHFIDKNVFGFQANNEEPC